MQPQAVETCRAHHHGDLPEAQDGGNGYDGGVPQQDHPGPAHHAPPGLGVGRGEQGKLPLAVEAAEGQRHHVPRGPVEPDEVDHRREQEARGLELDGQDHLQVIRRVQRVQVVLVVAGPEGNRVRPVQEAVDGKKDGIEPFGFEHRAVHQLVKPVQQERKERSVSRQRDRFHPPRGPAPQQRRRRTACAHQEQEAAGLQKALPVRAGREGLEHLPAQRGAVPLDLDAGVLVDHRRASQAGGNFLAAAGGQPRPSSVLRAVSLPRRFSRLICPRCSASC